MWMKGEEACVPHAIECKRDVGMAVVATDVVHALSILLVRVLNASVPIQLLNAGGVQLVVPCGPTKRHFPFSNVIRPAKIINLAIR